MATETKSKGSSVILKEPLPVIEVPEKKIISVEEESLLKAKILPQQQSTEEKEMDVDMDTDSIVTPNNQT